MKQLSNGLRLVSVAGVHPSRILTNDDLAKIVETDDEWIYSRSGIHDRYFCEDGESCVSMAIEAGQKALLRSGLKPNQISLCLVATISGDYATPSVSCMVQKALGLREDIPVMDINAACSGFVYALNTARALLADGDTPYALVIGMEQLSRLLDMTDRSTCVLFGDGGGAAVVERTEDLSHAAVLGARGDMAIQCLGAGHDKSYIKMDGKEVFRFAVTAMPACIQELLSQADCSLDDIDYVICHQANARIIDHCVKKLHADPSKFPKNMEYFGNTSAGSIPLLLAQLWEEGKLQPGGRVLLVGFGSGLTWGGILLHL